MFTQIRTLCRVVFFLWLTTGYIPAAAAGETCALITPETTLRIPAGYITAAYNVPVGGIIGETIFSDSIDVSQCLIDSGKEIEFVLVGGMPGNRTQNASGHTIYEFSGGIGYSLGAVAEHPECMTSSRYVDGRDSPDNNTANKRLCTISSGMEPSQPYRVRAAVTLYKLKPEIAAHHPGGYLGEIAMRVDGHWAAGLYGMPETKIYLDGFTVRQHSCDLDPQTETDVDLGVVSRTDFGGKGSVAPGSIRNLTIALQCNSQVTADIRLTGNAFTARNSPGTLKLQRRNGSASGVGVRLTHNGRPVMFGEPLLFDEVTARRAVLRLQAAFIQTRDSIEPGTAEAILNYTIRYQ
ncbi:TPA: type 1 fimbrial protein [Morganella morganii]|uniref:fimbrial protein n=1 Tax=Morganella morganii TaxID=582 RepID=UPI000F461D6A|nr:fimbrial protein [Morganella morganii]ROJ31562.1 fimbrial protein [Morganella morganii]HCU1240764.1 type 1 fimbrial protein [Morganella morganii]